MATPRQGNLYSVLEHLGSEDQGEDDKEATPDKTTASSMPSTKSKSKKKRRKSKKEPAVELADSLSLRLASQDLNSSEKSSSLQQQSCSSASVPSSPSSSEPAVVAADSLSPHVASLDLNSSEKSSSAPVPSSPSSSAVSAIAPSSGSIQCLPNANHSINPVSVKLVAPAAASVDNKSAGPGGSVKWPLVWIDLEMTGLDVEKDRILEIACIITDGRLQNAIEGPDIIINQSEELLASMGEWCQTHHTASGLVEGVRKSKITEKEAEMEVLNFVRLHLHGTKKPQIAGNSIYTDLMFIRKYMPDLAEMFSHVVVDVSSVKALCQRWYPREAEQAPKKNNSHRALEDIKESIAELKYMRKAIFKESRR